MYLEIVTPEAVLFSSKVDAISLPGSNGRFQILDNHAPIVSSLETGVVEIAVHSQEDLALNDLHSKLIPHESDGKILTLKIHSGTIELNDNKAVILAD